jgi:hypothetical protein
VDAGISIPIDLTGMDFLARPGCGHDGQCAREDETMRAFRVGDGMG